MTAMRKTRRKRMVKIPYKHQLQAKPPYHKALWHNCNKCRIHFMSETPQLTAYLCDECFNSMPHYRTKMVMKRKPKPEIKEEDWGTIGVLLYILGCSICLAVVAYYLWWK
jgi:hypothetical protein